MSPPKKKQRNCSCPLRNRFDVIFKGDDWKGTAKGRKLERDMASVGVEVVYLPYTVHTSSTMLRRVLDETLVDSRG